MANKEDGIDWMKKTELEYELICKQKRQKQAEEVKIAWRRNRIEINKSSTENENELTLTWNPEGLDMNSRKHSEVTFFDGTVDFLPLQSIPDVVQLPKMQMWAPLHKNIMGGNETELLYIPYIGDKEINGDFLDQMDAVYDGHVHGDDEDSDDEVYLDNETFVELVNALLKYQVDEVNKSSKSNENGSPNDDKKPFPCDEIFIAISEQVLDSDESDELRKRYIELTKDNDLECTPNIDGPEAKSLSRAQSLHSYKTLFCERCFKYDCSLHQGSGANRTGKSLNRRHEEPLSPPSQPCNNNCFMLLIGKKRKLLANDTKTSPMVENKDSFEDSSGSPLATKSETFDMYSRNSEWTASDQSLFRALREVFGENYCVIAQTMLTKTCQDVYEFGKKEVIDLPSTHNRIPRERKNPKLLRTIYKNLNKLHINDSESNQVHSFSPCDHDGPCNASCTCVQKGNVCEKFCKCSINCLNRFPGCKCDCKTRMSCKSGSCACFKAARECDPDLCTTCGADQIESIETNCKNVCVQRGLHKHLLMAPSDVAGWGIFLKDGAEKDDFISEYCGEVISQAEADRRGLIYDKLKCSFLFNLNKEYVIDATRYGNKFRFANHSTTANCYAKTIMVNGDHRIAVYAKQKIEPGAELFFDYKFGKEEDITFPGIDE